MKENTEIEELLAASGEGELEAKQISRLLELMSDDQELVHRFGSAVTMERLLSLALSKDARKHFANDTIQRISFQQGERSREDFASAVIGKLKRKKRAWVVRRMGILAAAAAVVFSLFLILKESPGEPASPVVAKIVGSETGDRRVVGDPDLSIGKRILIDGGLLEVEFLTGVKVVLNGPVDFEITGVNSGYLHHGRLVAEIVDEQGKGFTVDGPNGRLIDLGTKFGVSVDGKGEMEVHVIEGIVDALPKVGEKMRLRENEAMRLMENHTVLLDGADTGSFFTQMPPDASAPPTFVRWSFDEHDGERCFDTGHQLGGDNAGAIFMTDPEGGNPPERIKGPFSNALHLRGSGYLHSDFRGIENSGPRTVAFWVRVPEDFGREEGFGIVNWGSYAKYGSAWQIAINSISKDGPLGRLRIGTNGGEVVGVTDLRDGEWHHCAVVLYGDREGKPNTATHILLYVDGKIESASRKSVLAVDTIPQGEKNSGHPGVWIGRNMAYYGTMDPGGYGKYFRGGLDELVICDTALNHAEINQLRNKNEMPQTDE